MYSVLGGNKKQRELVFDVMVHVKQYVRNELGINDNHDGQNYFDLPYEKEAYKLQETLLNQFKEVYNYEMA